MGPVRVALLGYGLSGRHFHRPLIMATPGLELATVVTGDPGRRARAAAEVPGVTLLDSPGDLWARAGHHDLVVVATPSGTHATLARRALAAGLPVVVEKPLATTGAEAAALAEQAAAAGLALVPFHNRRWDADHLTLRRLLADGVLGEVLRYESRFERWRPQARPGAWRESASPEEGGGILLDLGAHLVDQALQLFGPVRRCYAEIDARRGGADDDVFVALEHASGIRSHLWAGALAAAPGPRLRVLGSRAAYVHRHLDGQEAGLRAGRVPGAAGFGDEPLEHWGRLFGGAEPEGAGEAVRPEPGRWLDFYAGIVACVRGGAPPPVGAADAVAGLEILDAARRSAARREVVAPGPPG
jgi:predicted dehydrogenase